MNPPLSSVTASDRLSFTTFVALAFHAAVIFGVAFEREINDSISNDDRQITVAVRLENHNEEADFKAQATQLGSGDANEVLELSSPTPAMVAELGDEVDITRGRQSEAYAEMMAWESSPSMKIFSMILPTEARENTETGDAGSLATQISLIEARLHEMRQISAKRPRVRTLTSVSTVAAEDAAYLEKWRQRVEQVGNQNYPEIAAKERLFGNVRLKVTVLSTGALEDVELLQSSGYRVLDMAAIRTVRQSAPFEPFPDAIRSDIDQLEIIRTWRFEPSGRVATDG